MSAISTNGLSQLHFIDDLITLRGGEKEQPDILACTSGTTIDRYGYFTAKRRDNLINNAAHILKQQGLSVTVISPTTTECSVPYSHDWHTRLPLQIIYLIILSHTVWKTGLPVRSAVLKPHAGELVVGWVTTSESSLLYVFCLLFSQSGRLIWVLGVLIQAERRGGYT
ncbi:hypothetical protein N7527_004732 [Penicillium freii]|nr:hypothetical protein N7527_004732 [Penicillium freii]